MLCVEDFHFHLVFHAVITIKINSFCHKIHGMQIRDKKGRFFFYFFQIKYLFRGGSNIILKCNKFKWLNTTERYHLV